MTNAAKLFVAGLSYKTAPVELREKLAVSPSGLRCCGCRLKIGGELSEVVLLSTCNRVEVYGVAPRVNGNVHRLFHHLTPISKPAVSLPATSFGHSETGASPSSGEQFDLDFSPHLYVHQEEEAVRHLFSVVSGLDSMVLGETEITGQVKHAYQVAQEAKLTGRVLNRLFQTALQTAKEIRTTTQIGRGATSVGSVAVELAEKIFDGDLSHKTVMIIGAGKMGEACVRHLAKRGARSVLVSNRSFDRAQMLAHEIGGQAIRFDGCLNAMSEADIVVSSTGCPQTILSRNDIESILRARRNRPLFLIDIAVPRDIDPSVHSLSNVYLYNIDDLQGLVRENLRHREQELARCHNIIAQRTTAVIAKLKPVEKEYHQPDYRLSGLHSYST